MLLSVVIADLYVHWDGRRRTVVGLAIASVLLLLTHYMNYAALVACLVVDYVVTRRRSRRLAWTDWAILLLPQLAVVAWVLVTRNPVGRQMLGQHQAVNTPFERLVLLVYEFRDLNTHEFIPLAVLLAAPVVFAVRRDGQLLRGLVALCVYLVVMAATAPTAVARMGQAEVRYLAPIVPLCLAIGVAVVRGVWAAHWVAGVAVAVLAFGTNVLYVPAPGPVERAGGVPVRSTLATFVGELAAPPVDPFTEAARWIGRNVEEGQSVWVLPSYATYPLMFLEPKAVYAWQFPHDRPAHVPPLPDVHFRLRTAPDYVVLFGPPPTGDEKTLAELSRGTKYKPVAALPVYGPDVYRPEIGWRSFRTITRFDPQTEGVYVFRKAGE
jgi:hypothetical protein